MNILAVVDTFKLMKIEPQLLNDVIDMMAEFSEIVNIEKLIFK